MQGLAKLPLSVATSCCWQAACAECASNLPACMLCTRCALAPGLMFLLADVARLSFARQAAQQAPSPVPSTATMAQPATAMDRSNCCGHGRWCYRSSAKVNRECTWCGEWTQCNSNTSSCRSCFAQHATWTCPCERTTPAIANIGTTAPANDLRAGVAEMLAQVRDEVAQLRAAMEAQMTEMRGEVARLRTAVEEVLADRQWDAAARATPWPHRS